MSLATTYGEAQDRYLELITNFPLRPIRSETELDEAITILDTLLELETLESAEADYLAVLSDLVEQYEIESHPISPASDAEILHHLLDAKGVTTSQTARETGISETILSEIFDGERQLNREQIGKLAHFFQVSPGVFHFDV